MYPIKLFGKKKKARPQIIWQEATSAKPKKIGAGKVRNGHLLSVVTDSLSPHWLHLLLISSSPASSLNANPQSKP